MSPTTWPTTWYDRRPEGILIRLQIQPRASRSEVVGVVTRNPGEPTRLKIKVAAPPVDGEANEELVEFLSRKLKTAKRNLSIVRGETGKAKEIWCAGLSMTQVEELLK